MIVQKQRVQDNLKRHIGSAGGRIPTGLLQASRTEHGKGRAIPARYFSPRVVTKDDPGRPRADPDHLERDAYVPRATRTLLY
jgi:hypothetical protein